MAQSATELADRVDADPAPPGPARISGGHLAAKAVKAEGVDIIFTLCGDDIYDIYDGCVDDGIRVIDVRHSLPPISAGQGGHHPGGRSHCSAPKYQWSRARGPAGQLVDDYAPAEVTFPVGPATTSCTNFRNISHRRLEQIAGSRTNPLSKEGKAS